MMELQKIETLLLQEMENVKGGLAGVCECTSAAGQSTESGGKCACSRGGAGQILNLPDKELPTCFCGTVGGAGQ